MDNQIFSEFYLKSEQRKLVCSDAKNAYLYYKEFRIDLLSGKKEQYPIALFFNELNQHRVGQGFTSPIVYHLFYELSFYCTGLESSIDESKPLAIGIDYRKIRKEDLSVFKGEKQSFRPIEFPTFKEYEKKFSRVQNELLQGNCYQVNLTSQFYFQALKNWDAKDYMSALWRYPQKAGAYSHGTYLPSLGKLFLSNSPECLFQVGTKHSPLKIYTMPIKGTLKRKLGEKPVESFERLKASEKNQSELFMITDLLRNDLTQINLSPASVRVKKHPLFVPGLVHQFSIIESELAGDETLKSIILALFPGGSITGAPKKNVVRLINEIEQQGRGFYCGSTVLLYQNIQAASINIRSIEVDFKENKVLYGSGGGVTLESNAQEEFEEMQEKLKSFLCLF